MSSLQNSDKSIVLTVDIADRYNSLLSRRLRKTAECQDKNREQQPGSNVSHH
jgi:hypothetical protein